MTGGKGTVSFAGYVEEIEGDVFHALVGEGTLRKAERVTMEMTIPIVALSETERPLLQRGAFIQVDVDESVRIAFSRRVRTADEIAAAEARGREFAEVLRRLAEDHGEA